jgi:hypothetical protein
MNKSNIYIRMLSIKASEYDAAERAMQRTKSSLMDAIEDRDDAARKEVAVWGLEMEAKKALEMIIENEGYNSSACQLAHRVLERASIATKKAIVDRDDAATREVDAWALDMDAKNTFEIQVKKREERDSVERR